MEHQQRLYSPLAQAHTYHCFIPDALDKFTGPQGRNSGKKLGQDLQNNVSASAQTASSGLNKWAMVAVVLTMFFWASTTIIVRYVRLEIPPFGLAFWRNTAAFFIILPFAYKISLKQWPLIRDNLGILSLLAILLWVGGNSLLFLGLQYTIAINAGVLNSVEPIFIVVLAFLLFRDPFSRLQGLGLVISLVGVLVLVSKGSLDLLLQLQFNIGDVIVTIAFVCWALYAVLLRKLPRELDALANLLVIVGLGAVFLLPLYIGETIFIREFPFNQMAVASVFFLAVFSSALAMFLWNYAIGQLGPSRAGQFLHLIPAFTVLLALLLLGEAFRGFHFAGIALIAAGIVLASKG